jgi:hypothetical protein
MTYQGQNPALSNTKYYMYIYNAVIKLQIVFTLHMRTVGKSMDIISKRFHVVIQNRGTYKH